MIIIKNGHEIESMRQACRITAAARALAGEMVRPGVSTRQIDKAVHDFIVSQGAKPSFLNYNGFPASACISVNSTVIHGIPGGYILKEGDIVSVDVGAFYKGFHGDSAKTFGVGEISEEAKRLIESTKEAFHRGAAKAVAGGRIGDIGAAISEYATAQGYGVVRKYVGHGVGHELHEDPEVPNYGKAGYGLRIREGMTLAIEPMVNAGDWQVRVLEDKWTVVTKDGSLSAHYENTVAITANGVLILTDPS